MCLTVFTSEAVCFSEVYVSLFIFRSLSIISFSKFLIYDSLRFTAVIRSKGNRFLGISMPGLSEDGL